MLPEMPGTLNAITSSAYEDKGRDWLAALPSLIAKIENDWQLSVDAPFPNLSYHFVAPCIREDGAPAVLKVGFPEEKREMFNEAGALRLVDGQGMVKLLLFDGERRAMLLEKLDPGENLKEIFRGDEIRAVDTAIEVMQKIWRRPPPKNSFPKLEDWFHNGFIKAGNTDFPLEYLRKAGGIFEELNPAGRRVLLHGDLHHENIVSAGREPFLAIDPKGITGNFAYEMTTFLLNHRNWLAAEPDLKERLDAAIRAFSDAFKISPVAIGKWTFAQSVLSACWTFEENSEKWRADLADAKIWED